MKLTFLGTGTSTGVPQIGCSCKVCTSSDTREKRTRTSVLLEVPGQCRLLIDCGPDFRQQIINAGAPQLTALLITHSHYDHVGGIDDLRPYCHPHSFPVYCQEDVANDIRTRLPYCFREHLYPGVPTFDIRSVSAADSFTVAGVKVTPIKVMHGKLPILGFRINRLAYITDCSELPKESFDLLNNLDTLVINALRIEPHFSHMNLRQALDVISKVNPRRAFLTHLSHDMGLYGDTIPLLPPNVDIALDGMSITTD